MENDINHGRLVCILHSRPKVCPFSGIPVDGSGAKFFLPCVGQETTLSFGCSVLRGGVDM